MKCDLCKQNDATVYISHNVNGEKMEQHLCTSCAAKQGMESSAKKFFTDFFQKSGSQGQSIFDSTGGIPAFGDVKTQTMMCPTCSLHYDDFRRSGLLGCSDCYIAFADRLDAIFRRVQGGTRHAGRKVCETADQQELKLIRMKIQEQEQLLQTYVAAEKYEQAATLRDEIKKLKDEMQELSEQSISPDCRSLSSAGEVESMQTKSPEARDTKAEEQTKTNTKAEEQAEAAEENNQGEVEGE